MYCQNCGTQNLESAKFCKECGENLLQSQNKIPQSELRQDVLHESGWNWGNAIYVLPLVLFAVVVFFTTDLSGLLPMNLDGAWSASDGSTKIFNSNGICSVGLGGGPQTCMLSSNADSSGRHTLQITRPFDEMTLYVKDNGGGQMNVSDENGQFLWTMTKK